MVFRIMRAVAVSVVWAILASGVQAFKLPASVGSGVAIGHNLIRTSLAPPPFVLGGGPLSQRRQPAPKFAVASDDETSDAPPPSSKAESILDEFHRSDLPFRIVVIGSGAILETTSKLGPTSSSTISAKTGDRLLTFASEDKSFEFHVKVDKVGTIAFAAVERPDPNSEDGKKTMRVARFLDGEGGSICSLILAESSPEAAEWFDGMIDTHGKEVVM